MKPPQTVPVPKDKPYYHLWIKLHRWCNAMAARTGGRIVLTGSALVEERPRDYDIRIILNDFDFQRQFGPYELGTLRDKEFGHLMWSDTEWRRGYDNLKYSRIASQMTQMNIDIQFIHEIEARDNWKITPENSVRLDACPDEFLDAGMRRIEAVNAANKKAEEEARAKGLIE